MKQNVSKNNKISHLYFFIGHFVLSYMYIFSCLWYFDPFCPKFKRHKMCENWTNYAKIKQYNYLELIFCSAETFCSQLCNMHVSFNFRLKVKWNKMSQWIRINQVQYSVSIWILNMWIKIYHFPIHRVFIFWIFSPLVIFIGWRVQNRFDNNII